MSRRTRWTGRRTATTTAGGRGCPRAVTCGCPGGAGRSCASCPGRPGAPVVVLLHGWTATADLNWFACFRPLAEHYRVIALDHRGHGRGLRSAEPFRLEQCADDVAALARRAGHRTDRARRLLDGRTDRPAGLAAPPRPRRRARAVRDQRHVHRHRPRAAAVRTGRRHRRGGQRRPDRSGHERGPRPLERLAAPPRLPVVGLRRGRPPRLDADRRGRTGHRSLRLPALDRRRRRAHRASS